MDTFIARVKRQTNKIIDYFYFLILIFPKWNIENKISKIIINDEHFVALNEDTVQIKILLRVKLFESLMAVRAFRVSAIAKGCFNQWYK